MRILPIIVLAQFGCTSLWFAGNAVMNDLLQSFNLPATALGGLTSAVQLGFISGTLLFALLTLADRFAPARVFFVCAIAGAGFNLATIWEGNTLYSLLASRFMVGVCLAGIYPVGMKIASDYYQKGLGKSLGYLVGALVVGTAFPHLLKGLSGELPWRFVLILTSSLAALGGLSLWAFVPNGPYRKPSAKLDFTAVFKVFKPLSFRRAAFGYFGHMWELYAFWAFVPVMLVAFEESRGVALNVPLLSFTIIGLGGVACVIGGYLAESWGTRNIALTALRLSGICCLLSPFVFHYANTPIFIAFLIFWGLVVIADSPLFSTLVAQSAPAEAKGTALTIATCLGFALTIFSIQLMGSLSLTWGPYAYGWLALGPGLSLLYERVVNVRGE